MTKFLQKFWPILFFAVICCLLFYKVFFFGQVFYEGDNFHLNIPAKYFLVQQLSSGIFPLWNPYVFLGIPYFADLNVGVLHPLNFLYFIFAVPRALTIIGVLDFFFMATFQYIFLRALKTSQLAAFLGGVIFAFGGTIANLYGNMTYLNIVVYIPLIFYFAYVFVQKRNLKYLLLLIFMQTVQFLSGHPQTTYYTMFFISLYLFFFSRLSFKKRIGITASFLLGPLLLSSVQLFSFVEYVLHANRPVGNVDYASWGNFTIPGFITFFLPLVFGNHVDGNWWGPQWIASGYISTSGLILATIGLWKAKFSFKTYAVVGLLLSLLLAMGNITPLFYIFYYMVPGWKFFRAPSGLLVYYTFFVSILAAYGLEYIKGMTIQLRKKGIMISMMLFILSLITTIVLYFSYYYKLLWQSIIQTLVARGHIHLLSHLLLYDTYKIQSIFITGWWNMLLLLITLLLTVFTFVCITRKTTVLIFLVILTTVSLLLIDSKIFTTTSLNLYESNLPLPSFLSALHGQYRMLSMQIDLHQHREHLAGSDYFLREAQGNLGMYKDDNNVERGLYQARGYSALIPDSYANFLHSYNNIDVTGVDVTHMTQQQLNQTSVKYILSHEPLQNSMYNGMKLQQVAGVPGKYYAYENTQALPRMYLLEDPYGNEIVNFSSGTTNLSAKVTTAKLSHIVVSDWYYPGWKAYVNGKEVPIQPYLTTFQEIYLPKGKSSVEFIYDPLLVKIGLAISIISFILWATGFIFYRKIRI